MSSKVCVPCSLLMMLVEDYLINGFLSAQVFSIPLFLLTIIAYCCLPELRNVHGKCFLSYLVCLTTSYSIISYINLSQQLFQQTFGPLPCLLMGRYYLHAKRPENISNLPFFVSFLSQAILIIICNYLNTLGWVLFVLIHGNR